MAEWVTWTGGDPQLVLLVVSETLRSIATVSKPTRPTSSCGRVDLVDGQYPGTRPDDRDARAPAAREPRHHLVVGAVVGQHRAARSSL